MEYRPLKRQEIAALLFESQLSLGKPSLPPGPHPNIAIQYRLEQAVNRDEGRTEQLRNVYVCWLRSGAKGDITDKIDLLLNGES